MSVEPLTFDAASFAERLGGDHKAAWVLEQARAGVIPSRKVGKHRRIRFEDVMAYRVREDDEREALLARIARESQSLGLEF